MASHTGSVPELPAWCAGTLGRILREHRQAAGLTQQDLAEVAGVSVGMIRDLEQERTRWPRGRSVLALLAALHLPGDLITRLRPGSGRSGPPLGPEAGPKAMSAGDCAQVAVDVLGPLVVRRGPAELLLGSGKQRAVLGRLALSANTVVPTGRLIDLLWNGTGPGSPVGAVHTHIWRIRSVLEPARPHRCRQGLISRCAGGYRLDLSDDRLDLARFRAEVAEAEAVCGTTPGHALDLLDRALGRWRGRPLADVEELADHPAVTAILDEQVAAVVRHADLTAALGVSHRSLPWLRQVGAVHPLHEPVQARLVSALAADGRQAEALHVYQWVRRRLVDDLGIDPGEELSEAHRRVLRPRAAYRAGHLTALAGPGSVRITTPNRYSA